MKRLLLFLCFGGLVTNNVIAEKNTKKHIVISENDHSGDYGKNLLKLVLPPLAGLSFLNYAVNPDVKLNPAFLFRGLNGLVCGMLNVHTVNNETLLRVEAGLAGALLVGSTIVKVIEGADTYFVRPTFKVAKSTYAGFKNCVDFVKNHKVLTTIGTVGTAAAIYKLQ